MGLWGCCVDRLREAIQNVVDTAGAQLVHLHLIAPFVLDGPMTGEAVHVYVEQFLAPVLAPSDVVVMDNLSAHKVAGIAQAIAATGAAGLPPRFSVLAAHATGLIVSP